MVEGDFSYLRWRACIIDVLMRQSENMTQLRGRT